MSRPSRIIVALAALSLAALYVLPLWHIGLKAPQYPEGLGLYIAADRIVGEKPQDLNSINGLNHYIGMKVIEPDDIPELRFMPKIIGGLIALGLLVGLAGRRGLLYGYAAALVAFAAAGLADFYKWTYDYGHNLDPKAIIKVPGMTYQPPLIGSKQLLNFHATSWPASGGWIAILAVTLVVAVAMWQWRQGGRSGRVAPSVPLAMGAAA
jgi:copper chaperone NosL